MLSDSNKYRNSGFSQTTSLENSTDETVKKSTATRRWKPILIGMVLSLLIGSIAIATVTTMWLQP
ncbi:unnamed protein product, partial [Adineta steineri]